MRPLGIGWRWCGALAVLALLTAIQLSHAEEPAAPTADKTIKEPASPSADAAALAARIDELSASLWKANQVSAAPLADDGEFVRRLYLDLVGRIPNVHEARDFLEDTSKDKRAKLVEKLLAGNGYVSHFTNVWRSLMIPDSNGIQFRGFAQTFEPWLRKRLTDNAPYDLMVREIITVNVQGAGRPLGGAQPARPAGPEPSPFAFYQANENKPETIAAASARLFLGVKIECAQCHKHPFARWSQDQFWEYAAFFTNIQGQLPVQGRPARVGTGKEIKIPDLDRVVQAKFLDGTEPKFEDAINPRVTLADWVVSAKNPYFTRAAANRLWAHFFGTGLVDPVDDLNENNPASNPELLDEMARQFSDHNFDLKFLIRGIVLSKTYQMTSALTHKSQDDARLFGRMAVKGLSPEQLFDSLATATGYRDQPNQGGARSFSPFGLNSPRAEFINKFSNTHDKRTEQQTSILQALALMNGKFIADATSIENSWTLAAIADYPLMTTEQKVEALYLAALTRKPRERELNRFVKYVESGGPSGDKNRALTDVFWVLLNGGEFILNH